MTKRLGTAREMHRLPVPGGSLGTQKILGIGATIHLGPLRLHVENLESSAQKWSALLSLSKHIYQPQLRDNINCP